MSYEPNYNDSRVQTRISRAINFCEKYLDETTPQWLSTRWIDHRDNFGCSKNQLSKYLRETLLIVADDSFNRFTGKTKTYRLNLNGLNQLRARLRVIQQTTYSVVHLDNRLQNELKSGDFEYKESSSRLYHPLQNFKRAAKHEVLAQAGYLYNYDIECAAPTLLHQYAQQLGMDEYLFTLRRYINDRAAIRAQIALEAEVPERTIKRIINGLFQGAHISTHSTTIAYQELNGDPAKIEFLKQHEFITALRADIKTLWEYIRPQLSRRTRVDKNGHTRTLPISGKQKTALYRDLERVVLSSVREYLDETNNQYFLEHDGWATQREVDTTALIEHIQISTGYEIKIDSSCNTTNNI